MVWKRSKNGLLHLTDESRMDLQLRINGALLEDLNKLAIDYETTVSYLLENGLENMLKHYDVAYNPATRNKGKVYFKASLDKEIVRQIKEISEHQNIKVTNIIDESVKYITIETVKNANHRHRVE